MGANLRKVMVVDVEATCWATKEEQGDQPNEIIEIGICSFDIQTRKTENLASYVVKPRFTKISKFCTELTGWTQAQVDLGNDVSVILPLIVDDYGLTKDHIWFSCGEYDRVKLGSQGKGSLLGLYGISRELNMFDQMRHVNVKTLFALKHRLSREKGMASMLTHLKLNLEGRHHNGADDAFNIAKIVANVLS